MGTSIFQNNPCGAASADPADARQYAIAAAAKPTVTVRRTRCILPIRQACLMVRDRSWSMRGTKKRDASRASQELADELACPQNGDSFRCGVVDFGNEAQTIHELCSARDLASSLRPIAIKGSTDIGAGLELAASMLALDPFIVPHGARKFDPVVVLYSDGGHNGSHCPRAAATRLKQDLRGTVVAIAFGADADEGLLRELASSPAHFYQAAAGADLRMLFAAVGRTMSASAAAGVDPRALLGAL